MSVIAMLALAFALGAASDDDEQEREDAIFGDSEDAPEDPPEELPQDVEDASDKLEERFGARLDEQQDPLAIGGVVLLRLESAVVDDAALDEQRVSTPNFLDVYFDARPTPRLRFYARGRVLADFTRGGDSPNAGLAPTTTGTGNLNRSADAVDTQLDQLWMKFDLGRRLYVTFGPQRIRWGAGQFWNPTDFLNRRFRDPLAFFDERLGVGLLKLHLPLESLGSNLYAIANSVRTFSSFIRPKTALCSAASIFSRAWANKTTRFNQRFLPPGPLPPSTPGATTVLYSHHRRAPAAGTPRASAPPRWRISPTALCSRV